jgi:hypothetical protein
MRVLRVSTLIVAALLVTAAHDAYAGGRLVPGQRGTLRGPTAPVPSSPFAGRHRFPRHPFVGGLVRDVDVIEVVREVPVAVPVVAREVTPNTAPVGEPKFVMPPERTAPAPPGSHTVVIQRGSAIEVQTLPLTTGQP